MAAFPIQIQIGAVVREKQRGEQVLCETAAIPTVEKVRGGTRCQFYRAIVPNTISTG
jgi:hypothetical protein